jgi:hypothetical protein
VAELPLCYDAVNIVVVLDPCDLFTALPVPNKTGHVLCRIRAKRALLRTTSDPPRRLPTERTQSAQSALVLRNAAPNFYPAYGIEDNWGTPVGTGAPLEDLSLMALVNFNRGGLQHRTTNLQQFE